jgi:hypothetical protein
MKNYISFVQVGVILVLLLVLTSAASATDPNADPNLVGWWKFDEGGGTVAIDSSGNKHNGTIYGSPTWGKGSPYDNSGYLKFNGSNTYVDINCISGGAFLLPRYTIAMWFRLEGGGFGRKDLFSATDANSDHGLLLELYDDPMGSLRYLHRYPFSQSGGADIFTTTTYNDHKWHHIAAVRVSNNSRLLYVDGQQMGSDSKDTAAFDTPVRVILGKLKASASERFWSGAIDDVRIYNRPLTQAEIKQIMTSP